MARRRRRFGSAQGPRRGRIGPGREFLVHPATCLIPKGKLVGADRRYTYVAWRCLPRQLKFDISARYPYSAQGIPDSAYAYPFKESDARAVVRGEGFLRNAKIANGRRALLWGLARTQRKVRRS
jgi:hypothetical protein